MLKECQKEEEKEQFAKAVNTKGDSFATESLFMALKLQ
jgi:hypothetical protein